MPTNPPVQTRRGSTRTRTNALNAQAAAASSKTGTITGSPANTRRTQQLSGPQQESSSTAARPGRPRREVTALETEEPERPTKARARPSRAREQTTSTTPSQSRSSSQERDTRSPTPSSAQDTIKDMKEDEKGPRDRFASPTPVTQQRAGAQRQRGRQLSGSFKEAESPRGSHSVNKTSKDSKSSGSKGTRNGSSVSKTPEPKQGRNGSNSVSEDRDMEGASSESGEEEGDGESDEDRQGGKGSSKETRTVSAKTPSKRRLRSNKLQPNVVAHLAVDGSGLDFDQIMDEYTEEQQQLQANTSAAEALVRLLRQGIQDSESLHPDMVDDHDYELIRHTFGDIEDLDLSLIGTMAAPDDSNAEDDELTKDLKRRHRSAKKGLHDVAAQYKAAKTRMVTQMKKELDAEEAQIKAGTHAGLLAELQAIEDRRRARIRIIEAERDYRQKMWENGFQAVCKAANDQYHAGQMAARKSIIDLVQSRMNRIRHELDHSNRVAARSAARRKTHLLHALKYRKPTLMNAEEASAYDSCDESCSSYDSYSSSGSECSDCEICKISPKHTGTGKDTLLRGLCRKEVALDLSFLFPAPPRGLEDSSGWPRLNEDDLDESSLRGSSKNQQRMIDRLNDEKRRRRRVSDRELQNKTAYKKHAGAGGMATNNDMDLDPDLENDPRSRSPAAPRGQGRPSAGATRHRQAMDHQPRFLPGFGPEGIRRDDSSPRIPSAPLPTSRQGSKYPNLDRYGRRLDTVHRSSPGYVRSDRNDTRVSLMERGRSGMHGSLPAQDGIFHDLSERRPGPSASPRHHPSQLVYRPQQEMSDAPPRSKAVFNEPSGSYRYHPYGPRNYPADPRYAYDHPVDHGPPRQRGPPPSVDPNGYQTPPRGRPLKNSAPVVAWAGPGPFPHAADGAHSSRIDAQYAKYESTGAVPERARPSSSATSSSAANGYGSLEGAPRTSPAMSSRLATMGSQPASSSLGPSRTHAQPRHPFRGAGPAGGGALQGNHTRSPVMIDLSTDYDRSPVLDGRRVPLPAGTSTTATALPRTPRVLTPSARETSSSKGYPNGMASMDDPARLRSPTRVEIDLTDDGIEDGDGPLRRVPTEGSSVRPAFKEASVASPALAPATAPSLSSASSARVTATDTPVSARWMVQNTRDSEVPVSGEDDARVSKKDDSVPSSSTPTDGPTKKEESA
ncbi:hypothetical protein BGZ68_006376 [Mortierella alpina]|nr:hypothetical protein BGZ68_006376 [Mortierella alpina]